MAIVGIGGLGCAAVSSLARAGVENFWLVDYDIFEITNINRQVLATTNVLGKYKVDVARDFILSINPNAKIKTTRKKLDEKIAGEVCEWAGVVIDCLDNPYPKIVLARACKKARKPCVFGSASGGYGMASVFAGVGKGKVDFERMFGFETIGKDSEKAKKRLDEGWKCASVIAPAPNLIGNVQAQMAICVILGKKTISAPKMLIYDWECVGFFALKSLA